MLYPDRFEYARPGTLEEALELMADVRDHLVISGGTVGVLMLKRRLVRPELVVDIGRLPELGGVDAARGTISLGSALRLSELEGLGGSPALSLISSAASSVGDPAIRTMGTLGGNVALGDPSNDIPPALIALGAIATVVGPDGERRVGLDRSPLGGDSPGRIRGDELLVRVEFGDLPAGYRWYYGKRGIRHLDRSIANVAALGLTVDGVVEDLRMAVGGSACGTSTGLRLEDLRGARMTAGIADEVTRRAMSSCPCGGYGAAALESLVGDALAALGGSI